MPCAVAVVVPRTLVAGVSDSIHLRRFCRISLSERVSLSDPDARPIRKGKLGEPNEFGYVVQLAEVTENTGRGARGLILPAATAPGNPQENVLLPDTVAELERLGLSPREVALDGGFQPWPDEQRPGTAGAREGVHRWPPGARLRAHESADAALPHRRRGPHQPPQAPLRPRLQPPQGAPGPADLDRVVDPRLQR
jgi:hypothetical protein